MSTYRIAVIAAFLCVVATGCAQKAPVTATAPPDAATAPAVNLSTPEGIVALGNRLTTYRRAIFAVTQDTYSYFAGGELSAEYAASSRILKLTSLEPDKAGLSCEYTPQGNLFMAPERGGKDAYAADCNELARRLDAHLTR